MTNHDTRYHSGTDEHVELKPNRARAGRKDVPILYVLLWSTALAVLVLAAIFFGFHAMVH
ncbi:MAG: hypothetical protein WDN29_15510 [Methylovirgula sp.]